MDLLQLEHFLAVCEEKTFTRAAERVFRTQSAVSQSIKKLEEEIGASLFARDMHEVTLTESGKVVFDYAKRMVRLRDETTRHVDALKHMQSGTLSIASHETAAVYLLPQPLRLYLGQYPDIRINIHGKPPEEIAGLVLDREIDIGFVKVKPAFHDLESMQLYADEMIVIAPPGHRLASSQNPRITDLGEENFVVHHQCGSTEQQILRLFHAHQTRCRIVAELWSFENIKDFVMQRIGLAIVPQITVQKELQDKTLVRIAVPEINIPRKTFMIYRDQGYLSEAARQFINIVRHFPWKAGTETNQPLRLMKSS